MLLQFNLQMMSRTAELKLKRNAALLVWLLNVDKLSVTKVMLSLNMGAA